MVALLIVFILSLVRRHYVVYYSYVLALIVMFGPSFSIKYNFLVQISEYISESRESN